MAGANPTLAVRVTANLDEMKRQLAAGGLEIAKTSKQLEAMSNAFRGTKLIQEVSASAVAIQSLANGVRSLDINEAAKQSARFEAALAKLRATGQPIPPMLQKTADELRQMGGAASAGVAPVQSLTSKLQGVAGTLGLAFGAAAVVSGLKSLISNTFAYAETIKDTSDKMGVSMEATQRWKFAAEQTGASLENVSKSVLKLSQGIAGGDKGLKEALAAAGVQFESLRGMRPEDAFNTVAAAIAKIPDPMLQAKMALEAFGKSGTELLPALREGFVSLADGVSTMSDDTINRLDDAKDAWAAFGRAVTIYSGEVVGGMMSVSRAFLTDWTTAAQIMKVAGESGMAAAIAMALGIDKARNSIIELSGSSKMYAAAASKAGDSTAEIAAALNVSEKNVQAYLTSLQKVPPVLDRTTTSLKGTERATQDTEKAAKELGITWSGSFGDMTSYTDRVTLALYEMGRAIVNAPPPPSFPVSLGPIDVSKIGQQIGALAPPPEIIGFGKRLAAELSASFSQALSGLGGIIIGAIQGGGSVAGAAFASLGQALGQALSKALVSSLTGSIGGIIGGFLGPLGALAGNALGGLIDKIGGLFKNQGRDDAKAFAASFGGFDALQQKMLSLGPAYDKLWRDLTQNTKGPAQVAAAIKAIEDAFRAQEAAATSAAGASATAFAGPAGAAGFPTKAELQQAAADAEAAYVYIRDSGLYTAGVVDQAFQAWQDSLAAAGDAGAAALKKIDAEMKSLQDSIAMEAPEEVMGVIEAEQRARLKALEEEKAATLVKIEEEQRAEEAAAATAEASATKAFDKTLADAKLLDGEMRRIFSQGYDIPFRFTGGPGGSSGGAGYGGAQANGGDYRVDKPTWFMAGEAGPERATFTPLRGGGGGGGGEQTIIVHVDGEVIARAAAKGMPRYLKLHGRGR